MLAYVIFVLILLIIIPFGAYIAVGGKLKKTKSLKTKIIEQNDIQGLGEVKLRGIELLTCENEILKLNIDL